MISAAEFLKWCEVFQVAINGSGGGGGGGSVNSVVGTANRITSTGGVNPVIDISAAYVGQTSITTLGNISTGTWNGTVIGSTYGGTGVNNGSSTITLGGSLTTSGAFASTFTMTAPTSVTFPTSGTLATTAQLVTPAALTKTDDSNVTLTLGGSPSTALVNAASMTLGWTGTLSGTRGGTGVNNGASTITLGGSFTTSGAFTTTLTVTGNTNVTLPTSGTLLTSAGAVTSITGTANQVIASASTGAVTLSLPQSIATGSSPTFVTQTLSGLTASQVVVTDASKVLASLAYTTTATASALVQRDSNANSASNRFAPNSNVLSMSGTLTLTDSDAQYQFLNPNGSNRIVQLPTAVTNMLYIIKNTGTLGNTLLVRDAGAVQIGNLIANGLVVGYYYNGTVWSTV